MWHEGSLKETRLKEEKVEHWRKEKNCHSGNKSLARWAEWASKKLGSMDCVLSAPMPMSEPGRRGVMCLRVKSKWAVRVRANQWLTETKAHGTVVQKWSSNRMKRLQQWLCGTPSLTSWGKLNEVRKIEFPTKQGSDHCSHLPPPARGKKSYMSQKQQTEQKGKKKKTFKSVNHVTRSAPSSLSQQKCKRKM